MSDFDLELQFIHVADAGSFEDDIWLEIAGVVWMADESFHFLAKEVDVFEGRVERDENVELLFHGFGTSDVFDPESVEDDVGDLDHFHAINAFEYCEEEGDLFDDEELFFGTDDVDSVTHVVGVLDKEEDTGAEEFLGGHCEDEGE